MKPLIEIQAETDRIHAACDEVERVLATQIHDAESWRIALGYIDKASLRVYQLRKQLLAEAMRRAADHRSTE